MRRIRKDEIKQLEETLRSQIEGEIHFDAVYRALYASDASNYRQEPLGVVIPENREALIKTVHICKQNRIPILPRGAGTSLAGQACNFAVIIDTTKYLNKVLTIDPEARTAEVEPGVVLDELNAAAAKYTLTLACLHQST